MQRVSRSRDADVTNAPRSQRAIGLWTATALVMGNMIGSGVFLLPASLAPYGGLALGGWAFSTIGAVLLALVFARLARFNPATGGPYAFTREAFGDVPGFLVAWGYWISVWSADAALAVAFVGYLHPFIPSIVDSPPAAGLLAVGVVWLLTFVNIAGVGTAGRVQLVTTALKILPLVIIGAAGFFAFNPAHFAVADTSAGAIARGTTASATLTLFALLGIECATIPAGDVQDPDRTIPRATVVGTLLTAAIYIVSTVGLMSLVAPDVLAHSTAPFADAARALAGNRFAALIAVGAAISCFGALNGWILIVGQVPMAAARDGLFPAVFARVSSRGTPAAGMVIGAVLTTALIAMNYSRGLVQLFTFIILLATLSTLVPYAFCALAAFMIQRDDP
ncbi:MAG TPA: amino acid permease, partial [Vicinamibacterales bacterium]|nr:amino acid permease [Vicinamibacterales bacterium]